MNQSIKNPLAFLLLLLICFFSIYFRFFEFGLYEDDISRFNFFLKDNNERFDSFKSYLNNFSMGRPLGLIFLNYIPSYLFDVGGLKSLYLFGLIIFSVNSFLVFQILKNSFPLYLAFFAAIFFIAFPLDALKPTIVRTFIIQISFFFCFLSCLIYLKGKKIISFFLFFLTLFIYEISIFVFLFVVFLETKEIKIKNLFKHFLICFLIILISLIIKKNFGNLGRASQFPELSSFSGFIQILNACILGIAKSSKILILRPLEIFRFFEFWMLLPMLFILSILFYVFFSNLELKHKNNQNKNISKINKDKFIILFSSIFFWFTSYSIMSGHRFGSINREFGRTTSTHLVSYFAIAIAIICVIYFLEKLLIKKYFKNIFKIILITYLSINLFFNLVIQDKIIENWKISKQQFKFIDDNIHDWKDELVIFLPNLGNKWSYINSWANFLILKQMYVFPKEWKSSPVAITVNKRNLILKNDDLYIKRSYNSDFEKLDKSKIIIVEYDKKNMKFIRKLGLYNIKHLNYEINLLKNEKNNVKKNQHYKIYTQ